MLEGHDEVSSFLIVGVVTYLVNRSWTEVFDDIVEE